MKKNIPQQRTTLMNGNVTPQAPDAERAVLGAIIGFGNALDEVLFLTADMFYDVRHQALYQAIMKLKEKNTAIDLITVNQEIRSMGKDEDIPAWYIAELTTTVVSHTHIVDHALIIKQKYLQRQVVDFSLQVQHKAGTDAEDIGDVLTDAEKEIELLQEILVGQEEEASYLDISREFYEDINRRMARFNNKQHTGIPTGLTELDNITSGWQGSELVILAARPGMGKTAVALHLAHSAASASTPVLIFSLEMPRVSLYKRSILSESYNLKAANLKSGDLANDLQEIDRSVVQISNLPIYVDDNAHVTMAYIRSKSRLLHKKQKCGMIIIDYLQLITAERGKYGNREQEIASMSRTAKLLAKELDVPVILLSQLNRDVDRRQDKRPVLSDLRESGAIEQDADMVIFIHRPGYYGLKTRDKDDKEVSNTGELYIAKYRNGPNSRVKFRHNDTLTRIFDF